jgi:hypothetical protein
MPIDATLQVWDQNYWERHFPAAGRVVNPLAGRARAEAAAEPKAGETHAFKQVTASVLPLINTGCDTGSKPGIGLGKRARPGRPYSPALSLPHDPPYNRSAGAGVVRLHNTGQSVDVRPL